MNKVVCSVLAVAVLGCSAASLGVQGDDIDMNLPGGWGPVTLLVLGVASMVVCLLKKSQLTVPMCVLCGLGLVGVSIYMMVETVPDIETFTDPPTTPAPTNPDDADQTVAGLNTAAASCGIVLGLAMLGCAATGLPKRAAASPNRKSPPRRR